MESADCLMSVESPGMVVIVGRVSWLIDVSRVSCLIDGGRVSWYSHLCLWSQLVDQCW